MAQEDYDPRWDIVYIGGKALTTFLKGVTMVNAHNAREEGDYRKEQDSQTIFDILNAFDETEDKLYLEYKKRQRKRLYLQ